MMLRLTICIATYNRAAFIGETLASILPQLDERCELLVVDGASTDGTEAVVRAQSDPENRLRYVKLARKGGVDQDYDEAVQLAYGDYCWLFSDDDLLKPGAVAEVTMRLGGEPSLLVVNAEARSANLTVLQQERLLAIPEGRVYPPGSLERLFLDTANFLTFIGGVVIRRDVWLARERSRYFGTAFIHVGVIFQQPLPADAIVVPEPWIVIRYGNASWTGRSFDIWMVQWPRLVWSFEHFAPATRRRITLREPWRSLKVLLINRAMATLSTDIYRTKYAPLMTSPVDRALALAISVAPGVLVNGAVLLAAKRFWPGDRLLQDNLRESRFFYRNVPLFAPRRSVP